MDTLRKILNSKGGSQIALVEHLIERNACRKPRVVSVLKSVDRIHFINPGIPGSERDAYKDAPMPIGQGQTISAPHMHAVALELLEPWLQPGARVLDVGSGSGYLTACMARLVTPGGSVLGLEKVPELARRSRASVRAACPDLPPDSWTIEHADALSDVLSKHAGFHAIHVGAAADRLPQELVAALLPKGRMVIPVGAQSSVQSLMTVDKDEGGRVATEDVMGVAYVPLTRPAPHEGGEGGAAGGRR
mmetsp:Transcript_7313/g.18131  ORF Transcript_7313/g.18131 Transcript_7313/m.18131 type:complete len:247 (-) Transcript_7313:479-1219(-)|eukprot:CAMPEP_0202866382 /NCGR_PEP_ID=MMETSP1391-20130828/7410_1 /ASSEMBLY_ACC=CAM_ASM_000867 /TAXON_ID=1034604 /ORGANISM="Chlamydomonas leiostraca, Strain SAG 11-49" /LENGTH=246 /DNA_ID=CAMNT_0049546321 /DNA_START=169 /DNA_END=909 /DNA_ORIENTATION=+